MISAWHDPWVPNCATPPLARLGHLIDPSLKVSDLINHSCGEWDLCVLRQCFSEEVCSKILCIPLSIQPTCDRFYWALSKHGDYSVKSGYWLGLLGHGGSGAAGVEEVDNEVWRLVWHCGGPPKLCHFWWQACKGSMAVKDVLFRRHIASDNVCGGCNEGPESIRHVLFECPLAKSAWLHSGFEDILLEAPVTLSMGELLVWLVSKVGKGDTLKIMTIAWAIWFRRNKRVHEQLDLNGTLVAANFLRFVEDYWLYARKVFGSCATASSISAMSWLRPPAGVVKVNFDAHISNSWVGLGVVCRDEWGKVLLFATRRWEGRLEVECAEAMAARFGAQIAWRFGYSNVWLEGDSNTVVNHINDCSHGFSPISLIYDDVGRLSKLFNAFVISHVKRAGNTIAHLVARWDTGGSPELICMNSIPQSISTLADMDLQ